jgi:hypothetical protein
LNGSVFRRTPNGEVWAVGLSKNQLVHFPKGAAGAVTHADLFLENPVKLPFLNIDLPLPAFFFLAPILFLSAHGYTLMHLVMLTEKAKDYDQALREQIGADSPTSDKLRRQLPSNIPANRRKSAFGYARLRRRTTLAVAATWRSICFASRSRNRRVSSFR